MNIQPPDETRERLNQLFDGGVCGGCCWNAQGLPTHDIHGHSIESAITKLDDGVRCFMPNAHLEKYKPGTNYIPYGCPRFANREEEDEV